MDKLDMLNWGANYGYPFLVLSTHPMQTLSRGWQSWYTFLRDADWRELSLLRERIRYWEQTYRVFADMAE